MHLKEFLFILGTLVGAAVVDSAGDCVSAESVEPVGGVVTVSARYGSYFIGDSNESF